MSGAQREAVFRGFDRWGWDERSYTRLTSYNYVQIARRADAWLQANRKRSLLSARYDDFKAYLFSCKPTSERRNQIRQGLIAFLDYLVDEEYRVDNPCRELPRLKQRKRVPKACTGVAGVLWAEAKAEDPMLTALLGLYLWGGLRRNEGRFLKWDDIDLPGGWIAVMGKGSGVREGRGKERRVWIHPELAWALRRWRAVSIDPEWVFPSPRIAGQPISETWGRRRLLELGERIGIRLHPHLLRATVATKALRNGANIHGVRALLGHESLETTQRYLEAEPPDVEAAVKAVEFSEEKRSG